MNPQTKPVKLMHADPRINAKKRYHKLLSKKSPPGSIDTITKIAAKETLQEARNSTNESFPQPARLDCISLIVTLASAQPRDDPTTSKPSRPCPMFRPGRMACHIT